MTQRLKHAEPIEFRHAHITQHDRRRVIEREIETKLAILRPDCLEPFLGEQLDEVFANQRVVLDDQCSFHRHPPRPLSDRHSPEHTSCRSKAPTDNHNESL